MADWDSTSYTRSEPHCLRRLDAGKTYPSDLVGEVHADGEIWSQALRDMRKAIGNVEADTAILEGQFGFDGGTMPAHAADIVAAAKELYGQAVANRVTAAFPARGILGRPARGGWRCRRRHVPMLQWWKNRIGAR